MTPRALTVVILNPIFVTEADAADGRVLRLLTCAEWIAVPDSGNNPFGGQHIFNGIRERELEMHGPAQPPSSTVLGQWDDDGGGGGGGDRLRVCHALHPYNVATQ